MNARLYALVFLAGSTALVFADWPQWRGPDRDGLSKETGLRKEWPKDGPKLLWKATGLGGGYSTPSIVGNKLYALGAKGLKAGGGGGFGMKDKGGKDNSKGKGGFGGGGGPSVPESLVCIDLTKPDRVAWATEFGATGKSFPGPRSTPTVDGDRVYAISSNGVLGCFSAADGKLV